VASANDLFANRIALGVPPSQSSVDPTGNGRETGEPTTFGSTAGTAWWTYTPAVNQTVTFTTEGSLGDTVLGIFTGIAVNALVPVASDHGSAADGQSKITVALLAGITYAIQVGSFTSSIPSLYTLSALVTDLGYERVAHDFASVIVDREGVPVHVAHDFAGIVVDRRAPIRSAHDFAGAVVDRRAPIRVAHVFASVIIGPRVTNKWAIGEIRGG
jgi:hypothetical protein